jgi:predicted ATPase
MGDTPELFRVLWGLWAFQHVRADYQAACALGEDLLHLAAREHDPALLVEAHFTLAASLYFRGEFEVARRHCEQSLAHYDAQQQNSLVTEYGFDPAMSALVFEALVLWFLGYPEQALRQSQASLTLAHRLAHPFSLAYALDVGALPYLHRREWDHAHARADAAVALATEHGFPHWVAESTVYRGRTVAEHGNVADGIAQIQWGIAASRDTGAEVYQSYFLSLLAEAYQKNRQVEEGLAAVAEALAFVARTEERFYEAEVYRIKGELTLQKETRDWGLETGSSPQAPSLQPLASMGVMEEAEGYFLKAIEIAQRQQAKSLELRAATCLTRLWQQQGKTTEARELLAPVYNWFTEGFDTKDLQDAKALLGELS